ncbi:beta-1,3-galactosyltransferase 2 isoform X5 [Carassius gibelio]|uniref:beta-1,3-galactosyltransferase 2 isoform X3 n=1 Tax=Carassius gibelio TaxID=101364 RepID=UPI0022786A33|nr:beta-1,3-galactosyltransferase 2 isoform X3 [Carassius gibelio]XP_052404415.1 beta-1,3-galactosyltransferase 2 isoform X4 [Carassius gibelio]XP_052404416.1 beta-1,3-galactosyltransferase 2 isoform X5 [Carassius gibelio]
MAEHTASICNRTDEQQASLSVQEKGFHISGLAVYFGRPDKSNEPKEIMRWKRRHRYCSVALFLIVLVFAGGLVIQGQWPCHFTKERFAAQELQTMKTFSNLTMMNPTKLRELEESPSPLNSKENVISVLDESLQQGLESSLLSNISSSEEMRVARILKEEPYEYILNEPNACLQRAPFLVLLIEVEPKKTDARDAIRKTWANESVAGGLGFIRLFFIGVNKDTQIDGSKLQHTIEEESHRYHDIVQQDYRDTYNNLTLKTLMGMYWITKYCPEAKYVMKTDSDMFVNTEYLIEKLLKTKGQPMQKYFTGLHMSDFSPNRNKESKWYMPEEVYPGKRYPTFCSGTGYVFSGDVAQRIYVTSLTIPRLHLEDVYVGICLAKLKIEPTPPPNEHLFNHWRVPYSSCRYSNLITSHGFHPNEIIQYWQHLQSNKHNPCQQTG